MGPPTLIVGGPSHEIPITFYVYALLFRLRSDNGVQPAAHLATSRVGAMFRAAHVGSVKEQIYPQTTHLRIVHATSIDFILRFICLDWVD